MAGYYPITLEEMQSFIKECSKGTAEETFTFNSREVIYEWMVTEKVGIRVYSSIVKGYDKQVARGMGRDAIRVVLFSIMRNGSRYTVKKARRVHRVEGWKHNLQERIDYLIQQRPPSCPRCQGIMQVRVNSKSKKEFYGCIEYPACRGAREIARGDTQCQAYGEAGER